MDISINASFLPHTDADESLTFYRDILGFELRLDVGAGRMRWLTVGLVGQPDTSIVLATPNVDEAFAEVEAKGAHIVQEPMDQPYGLRDCALRDPAGNMIRIQQRG